MLKLDADKANQTQSILRQSKLPSPSPNQISALHHSDRLCCCADLIHIKFHEGTAPTFTCSMREQHLPSLHEGTVPTFTIGLGRVAVLHLTNLWVSMKRR